MVKSWGAYWCLALAIAVSGPGCQQQGSTETSGSAAKPDVEKGAPPVASISAAARTSDDRDADDDDDAYDEGEIVVTVPDEGTAEWLIREIVHLKLRPLGDDGDEGVAASTEKRKERNREIVNLATQAIAKTHADADVEHLFNAAVHHLLEARLQLALQGDAESIDALYEEANALNKRDPDSKAAAEAALTLVNFAYSNARRFAAEEPRWLDEFGKQAVLYARNYPSEKSRSIPLLLAAAQSCDLHARPEVAARCYRLITEEFPDHQAAGQAAAALRRLQLEGKPLELAGPTIDGSYVSIEDYHGRPVLVIFWSSHTERFARHLKTLEQIDEQYGDELKILAVNLDTNEAAIDAFVEQTDLRWSQIFYSEPEKRGWKHPAAVYYGVANVPTYWLVNRQGIVERTHVTVEELPQLLDQLR